MSTRWATLKALMVTLWSGDTMSPVCQHTSHPGRARYENMLMYHGCATWGIPRRRAAVAAGCAHGNPRARAAAAAWSLVWQNDVLAAFVRGAIVLPDLTWF